MSDYLLCSTPAIGHVAPMTAIGAHLVAQGHHVRMITGSRHVERVCAAGMEHIALSGLADIDPDAGSGEDIPDQADLRGFARVRVGAERYFIDVVPEQFSALHEALQRRRPDAVLAETNFTGVLPLVLGAADELTGRGRPGGLPVMSCSVFPLPNLSRDTAPFSTALPPARSVAGRLRNRALNRLVRRIFRPSQRVMDKHLTAVGARPLPEFFFDSLTLVDRVFHVAVPSFEYPRSDFPTNVDFVGPILPASRSFDPPQWWPELDGSRDVVLVNQGTLANTDVNQLFTPTIKAFADREDVLLVVTTGRPDTAAELARWAPANVRVAAFLPFDRLLPKVDVMVTNGGYGGVQFALAHGVPLVVAGGSEDKPEIAMRVAWSGTGVDLKTGSPTPAQVLRAVEEVRRVPGFRHRAAELQAEIARSTPLDTISAILAEAVDRRTAQQTS